MTCVFKQNLVQNLIMSPFFSHNSLMLSLVEKPSKSLLYNVRWLRISSEVDSTFYWLSSIYTEHYDRVISVLCVLKHSLIWVKLHSEYILMLTFIVSPTVLSPMDKLVHFGGDISRYSRVQFNLNMQKRCEILNWPEILAIIIWSSSKPLESCCLRH